MRMVIAPLSPHKAFVDNCTECSRETEWWLETGTLDGEKKKIELRFYCKECQKRDHAVKWRRTVIADLPI